MWTWGVPLSHTAQRAASLDGLASQYAPPNFSFCPKCVVESMCSRPFQNSRGVQRVEALKGPCLAILAFPPPRNSTVTLAGRGPDLVDTALWHPGLVTHGGRPVPI